METDERETDLGKENLIVTAAQIKEEIDCYERNCEEERLHHENLIDEWKIKDEVMKDVAVKAESLGFTVYEPEIQVSELSENSGSKLELNKVNVFDFDKQAENSLTFTTNAINFENDQNHNDRVRPKNLYKCSVCCYQTKVKHSLKIHFRIHTGEKPFKCDVCSYSTARSSDLKKHSKIHTGERPFKCETCTYSATGSTELKRHFRIHTGVKPFKCEVCSYSTARSSDLKKHCKIHTRQNSTPKAGRKILPRCDPVASFVPLL